MKISIKDRFKKIENLMLKPLAVLGLLAILGVLIFSINSITKDNSYLSSASVTTSSFFNKKENLFINTDSLNQKSGQAFNIFFKRRNSDAQGSYSLMYPCFDNFYFETITYSNNTEKISCDIPFNITSADNVIKLKANSTKNRYVDMPITISFTPNGKSTPIDSASVTLSISNENILNKETSIPPTNQSLKTDLKITIVEIGILDKATKEFIKSNSIGRNDTVAVRFTIENIGSKSSGPWRFNATLPTYPPRAFNSETEVSLDPQSGVEFTIGFDQAKEGKQIVKFLVDPDNAISEDSEENNIASVEIKIL